jgi:hypothetical protein
MPSSTAGRDARRYNKKGRPTDGLVVYCKALGLLCSGLFSLNGGLFAFDVGLAAFFMLVFIVLFSHNCLYFSRWLRFGVGTMNFCRRRFNLYFLPVMVLLALVSGCQSTKKLVHHKDEPVGIVRIHVESESSQEGFTKSISVMRSHPVTVNITTDPIVTEADVTGARLLSAPGGGFVIELKFEETAGWKLEQISAINPGKHLVIFAQWNDKPEDGRWLAAPKITRRMAGGILTFTPDASHEEAEKLVKGLNEAAKNRADDSLKP